MVRQLVTEKEAIWQGRAAVVRLIFPGSGSLRRIGLIDVGSYALATVAVLISGLARFLGLRVFGFEVDVGADEGVVLRERHLRFSEATSLAEKYESHI